MASRRLTVPCCCSELAACVVSDTAGCIMRYQGSQAFLPLRWGAGPMALMLWLNLVI
jgi:hypothetical protein